MEVVMRSGVAQKVTGKRLCCLSEFSWITLNFRGIESGLSGLAISSVTWASHVQMPSNLVIKSMSYRSTMEG